ncbi:unnamed protein product, partial [Gulo gulo]
LGGAHESGIKSFHCDSPSALRGARGWTFQISLTSGGSSEIFMSGGLLSAKSELPGDKKGRDSTNIASKLGLLVKPGGGAQGPGGEQG